MTNHKQQKNFRNLLKMRGEPSEIAKGFALGSFIGMLPFPGFQMIISGTLAAIFKINKTAAIAGVFNTNLATGAFIFAFNYWLGKKILGIESTFHIPDRINFNFLKIIIEAGSDVFVSLLIGGLITGIIAMILGYQISLLLLRRNAKTGTDQ